MLFSDRFSCGSVFRFSTSAQAPARQPQGQSLRRCAPPPRGGQGFFEAGRLSPCAFLAFTPSPSATAPAGRCAALGAAPRKRGHPERQPAFPPSLKRRRHSRLLQLFSAARKIIGASRRGIIFRGARACFIKTKQVFGAGALPPK